MQEANANVCSFVDVVFDDKYPDQYYAVVMVTVTSTETKYFDEPVFYEEPEGWQDYSVQHNFTIDEIIYSEKEFPVIADSFYTFGSVTPSPSEEAIGKKHAFVYGTWLGADKWNLQNLCSFINPLDIKEYIDLRVHYEDVKKCPDDMEYLIKKSNHKKVCVTPETQEKLIQRGYGFVFFYPHDDKWKNIKLNND